MSINKQNNVVYNPFAERIRHHLLEYLHGVAPKEVMDLIKYYDIKNVYDYEKLRKTIKELYAFDLGHSWEWSKSIYDTQHHTYDDYVRSYKEWEMKKYPEMYTPIKIALRNKLKAIIEDIAK